MPKPKTASRPSRAEADAQPVTPNQGLTFKARIMMALNLFGTKANNTEYPIDKDNKTAAYAEAYMWDFIAATAKKRSDAAWKYLENEALIADYAELPSGEHELGETPTFKVTLKVSNPIVRFNPEDLAETLRKSKYKVPVGETLLAVERAKKPTKGSKTLDIVEIGA